MRVPPADRISGALLMLAGGYAYHAGSLLPPVPGQQVGPSAFPMVIGAGLVLCGALILLGVGRGFEVDDPDADEPGGRGWRRLRLLIPPAALLFYVLAVDRIGFVPTGALMALAISRALGARWRLALGVAIVAPVLIHLVFLKLLRVPLPAGLLPMPW